jgi:hypothetical protein
MSSPPDSVLSPTPTPKPRPFLARNEVDEVMYDCDDYPSNGSDDDSTGVDIPIDNTLEERMDTQQNLQQVTDTLRRVGWRFRQFLLAWIGQRKGSCNIEIEHRTYRTVQQRREVLLKTVIDDLYTRTLVVDQIGHELDDLTYQPLFNQFDHTTDLNIVDFQRAARTIEETAPVWYAMVLRLISNQRAHRRSYGADKQAMMGVLEKRLYSITSIVCHSRAKQQSNVLPSMLTIYLMGSGVKRRVIEVLAGLGITEGYHQGKRLLDTIAENSRK